eukprot:811306-Rhodomonas_salina.2
MGVQETWCWSHPQVFGNVPQVPLDPTSLLLFAAAPELYAATISVVGRYAATRPPSPLGVGACAMPDRVSRVRTGGGARCCVLSGAMGLPETLCAPHGRYRGTLPLPSSPPRPPCLAISSLHAPPPSCCALAYDLGFRDTGTEAASKRVCVRVQEKLLLFGGRTSQVSPPTPAPRRARC